MKKKVILNIFSLVVGLAALAFAIGPVQAGNLEPSGPPGPTMKTLDEIPPTWSQTLQCDTIACSRFEPVMGGAAVLDKETGLVWEQSPRTSRHTWSSARAECTGRTVGGRKGWRLPSVHELLLLRRDVVPLFWWWTGFDFHRECRVVGRSIR